MMIKNLTRMIDLETGERWRVQKRTRGTPRQLSADEIQLTWVLVLVNKEGDRRFIAEERMLEFFRFEDAEAPQPN